MRGQVRYGVKYWQPYLQPYMKIGNTQLWTRTYFHIIYLMLLWQMIQSMPAFVFSFFFFKGNDVILDFWLFTAYWLDIFRCLPVTCVCYFLKYYILLQSLNCTKYFIIRLVTKINHLMKIYHWEIWTGQIIRQRNVI